MSASKWFVRPLPRPSAALRLVCLPYAGGSAATYVPWAAQLPAGVELAAVQPPGRASRILELAHTDMDALVAGLAAAFRELSDKPYVLFGHSLGSRVAYEFARRAAGFGLPSPRLLIASGSRAPHFPATRESAHDLPEAQFIAKLRELNGTPEEVLNNRELVQFLIPLLRADFKIAAEYRATPVALPCPLVVLAGTEDHEVGEAAVEGWREVAGGACEIHWIPGGHFFVEHSRAQVLERVNAALARFVGSDRVVA
ncbi:thioesterase II family protein [Lysobacter enzymogenes]|uniref:thioesterase II family protein n=1 Tax=Lysobacter enzymogenes TaxID=69 RepID=UPI001A97B98A|nr:alpha/beta fold hydrolase [Lysobacter enzymogenes]QQP95722.1 thioesterase [Lysobacter enzymogenes]